MPKDESADALKTIHVQALSRAVRSIMGEMCKRRYQWLYASSYMHFFVILPNMPGSLLYKATH